MSLRLSKTSARIVQLYRHGPPLFTSAQGAGRADLISVFAVSRFNLHLSLPPEQDAVTVKPGAKEETWSCLDVPFLTCWDTVPRHEGNLELGLSW